VLEGEPHQLSCALCDVAGGAPEENQGIAPGYKLDQLPKGMHGTHIGAIAMEGVDILRPCNTSNQETTTDTPTAL